MKAVWKKKLDAAERRYAAIEEQAASGDDWSALAVEYGRLTPLVGAYRDWQKTFAELNDLATLAEDEEMRALAEAEREVAQASHATALATLRRLLSPEAAEDARNCFVEIRAAVGGNESCLFAAVLLRMYMRAADLFGWRCAVVSQHEGEVGGYKEAILRLDGAGVYGRLKFESGAHRVQRVPQTESQGRVHTSVVTVAVLPAADAEEDISMPPSDLRIETFRASGAGGQHVNTTDSAVRIIHLPSGTVAECQDERSQHKNREKAMSVLRARVTAQRQRQRQEEEASHRRLLVGSGDRSDRIRTYNFPQGRLTDHRIGLTLYKLNTIMEGDIAEILDALASADEEDRAISDE